MPVLRHDGDRGEGRDTGLADCHHVCTRPDDVKEINQVLDVFVQSETPVGQGYVARIMAMPEMVEWIEAARNEVEEIDELDMEF